MSLSKWVGAESFQSFDLQDGGKERDHRRQIFCHLYPPPPPPHAASSLPPPPHSVPRQCVFGCRAWNGGYGQTNRPTDDAWP